MLTQKSCRCRKWTIKIVFWWPPGRSYRSLRPLLQSICRTTYLIRPLLAQGPEQIKTGSTRPCCAATFLLQASAEFWQKNKTRVTGQIFFNLRSPKAARQMHPVFYYAPVALFGHLQNSREGLPSCTPVPLMNLVRNTYR